MSASHYDALVFFGATGDLTARKLLPALYDLACENQLPDNFYILGVARRPLTNDNFREKMRTGVAQHSRFGAPENERWQEFARRLHYQPLDANQPDAYARLRESLHALDRENHTAGNHLFYLSVAPSLYAGIVEQLGAAGLARQRDRGRRWTRIIIEKPFGHDLASARDLDDQVQQVFNEEQVYRIDHYLGKETV